MLCYVILSYKRERVYKLRTRPAHNPMSTELNATEKGIKPLAYRISETGLAINLKLTVLSELCG